MRLMYAKDAYEILPVSNARNERLYDLYASSMRWYYIYAKK